MNVYSNSIFIVDHFLLVSFIWTVIYTDMQEQSTADNRKVLVYLRFEKAEVFTRFPYFHKCPGHI